MNRICAFIFSIVSIILVCAVPAQSEGGTTYTLDQLIERSLSRYELLKASQSRIREQKYSVKRASEWDNPEVSVSGGRKSLPGASGYIFGVELKQNFYFPGKRGLRREIAEYSRRVAKLEHDEMALFIKYEVTRRAYAYAAVMEQTGHVKHRLERLRLIDSYLRGRRIIAPQRRVERDIIRFRVKMLERIAAENLVKARIAFDHLNVYACAGSIEADPPVVDVEWYRDIPVIDIASARKSAMKKNLLLRRYRDMVSRSRTEERLIRRAAVPDPGISLFYSEEHAEGTERSIGGGVTLVLPLLTMNRNAAMMSRARIEEKKYELSYSERNLVNEINVLYISFRAASELIGNFPISYIGQIEQRMRYADREFRRGRVDLQSYLEMDSMAHESMETVYEAQVRLVNAHTGIMFLTAE